MAATTGQLGLVTPTQGDLNGTWGDTVNNGITEYTNIAIAGTLLLTGDGAVTLANTTGTNLASNITSTLAGAGTVTAQFAIVRITGTTTTKVITGPSYSKTYLIDNASSFAVTFKASGQTGVSIAAGEEAIVFFNSAVSSADYVKAASSVVSALTGTLPVANGGTGQTTYTDGQLLIGNTTGNTLTKATLTAGSGISITNGTGSISIANTAAASQWTTTGSDIYYNTGLVGIGAIPVNARKLTVSSAGQSDLSIVAGSSDYGQLLFGYVGADNKGIVAYNNADNSMQFFTNNTERARFNSTGALILAGGTTSADGKGITFPATQSASTNANTLDDYEEGTFTPSITATGVTAYSVLEGKYTKIGQVVIVNVKFRVSTSGGGTGQFNITNAPFSQTATFQATGSARESGLGTGFLSSVWMASSSTDIYVSDAQLSGSYGYAFTLVYHV